MRSHWLWSTAVVLAASFLGSGCVNSASSEEIRDVPDTLTLRKLSIVDEEGRVRITLGMSSCRGVPQIALLDEAGGIRISLEGTRGEDDPEACLFMASREDGHLMLGLPYGFPVLLMGMQECGDYSIGLGINPDCSPGLGLMKDRQGITFKPPSEDGNPYDLIDNRLRSDISTQPALPPAMFGPPRPVERP